MGNSSETQDRILENAIRCFAKNGYHGTKTADIARESGVSEGTVFKYYSTKKDILRSVMTKIVRDMIPGIMFGTEEDFQSLIYLPDPKEGLKRYFKTRIENVNRNIGAFKVFINELQYHEDIMNEYIGQFVPRVTTMFEGFFSLGMSKGIFRQINPHTVSRCLVGMMATIILEGNVLKKPVELDKELDAVFDILFSGICTRKEG